MNTTYVDVHVKEHNTDFINRLSYESPIPNFKEIRPAGDPLIHVDRRTHMANEKGVLR